MERKDLLTWLFEEVGIERPETWWIGVGYSLFSLIVIVLIALILRSHVRRGGLAPKAGAGLYNIVEVVIEWLRGIVVQVLGKDADEFFPIIGSVFIYILVSILIGLIPGILQPTAIITHNLACSLVVFVYYNIIGMKKVGFVKYIKGFLGPVVWMAPLFVVVEIITHLARPLSLSLRLYGNMSGERLVEGMFEGFVPILVPAIFVLLTMFVAVIQAFVFSILTTVYIALAIKHE
jgi:F-type H+-transporting ATPase subunit a